MAGDWIKFDVSTFEKPEVIAIADELGIPETHVVGCLLQVWAWFDSHTENGNAPSVTLSFVNRKTGVAGFAESMQKVGWLTVNDQGICMPGFESHNGKSAKKRALTARRVAKHKANAEVTPGALPREEKSSKEKDKKEKSPRRQFKPPSVDDVRAYCQVRGNSVDPQKFVDHYAATNWHRGKTKIQDWQACVRTWEGSDSGGRLASVAELPRPSAREL